MMTASVRFHRIIFCSALALPGWGAAGCTGCSEELATGPAAGGAGGGGHGAGTSSSTSTSSSSGGGGSYPSPFVGWEPLAGVPAYCQVYAASEPDKLPPLEWAACPDGTPGCLELQINWTAPASKYLFYVGAFAGATTSSGPLLAVPRRLGGELAGWYELVLAYVDGPVVASLRSRDSFEPDEPCSAVGPAVGATRIVASIVDWTLEGNDYIEHEISVPLSGGVPTVFNTLSKEMLHGNTGSNRSPGPWFMAMDLTPGSHLLTVPYDGSPPTVIAKFSLEHPWLPMLPLTVGADVVFWADESPRTREHVYHSETSIIEPLVDVDGADVTPALSDGQTLAWMLSVPPKAISSTVTAIELWSSPLSTLPPALAPEKVADVALSISRVQTYFESGLVVLRHLSWSRDIVLRLSDNMYWTLDAPAGMWWGSTLYAAPDEIAMPVQPPYHPPETFTIRRQRLADLGSPQPVSGPLGE